MYFPTASTSLKYIFSHAFRAPDPYDEFYVDQVDITATNKSLKPENINSHTLLLEHAFNSRATHGGDRICEQPERRHQGRGGCAR